MNLSVHQAHGAKHAVRATALISCMAASAAHAQAGPASSINTGDTAWMLICSVLVILMVVPGIALFYSGMVRRKNALATMGLVLGSAAFVSVSWLLAGYSFAFGSGSAWFGGASQIMLAKLSESRLVAHAAAPTVPEAVFVLFQMGFAMVTVALIFGAVVERIRFSTGLLFALLWTPLVYAPVARWVWQPDGWLHAMGHMDYAGGTVVHMTSGVAGLVLASMTGNRHGYGREAMTPHNLMITVMGAGMLWVGWFGFNGGSALRASPDATVAVLTTQIAASSGVVGWLMCEWFIRGQVTVLGLASGLLAGMIAITPASGYVSFSAAFAIGVLSAVICYCFVTIVKARMNLDDSLDIFGLHGVGGFIGTVLTGVFQTSNPNIGQQVLTQLVGSAAVVAYVAAGTALVAGLLKHTLGLRVQAADEADGLDRRLHGESLAA